ncbi:MAG: response regulator [Bryobacteraceae bacterium]|jgi:signal transduction histidine kinase/CheY-like chemotaxis protein
MQALRDISIKRKLVGINLLTGTVALLLACATFLTYELLTYRAMVTKQLTSLAQIIAHTNTAALLFEDRASATESLAALRAAPNLVAACIYTRDGRPLAVFLRGESRRDLPRRPGPPQARFGDHSLELFEPVVFDRDRIGSVYLKRDLRDLYERLQRYAAILLGVLLMSSAAVLLLSSRLQNVISQPILSLANMAGRVSAERNYALRAPKRGRDEIGILVDRFNEMMEQIQTRTLDLAEAQHALELHVAELCGEIAQRRQAQEELLAAKQSAEESSRSKSVFLANMSHELRTPLNAIIGYSEMLREEADELGRGSCSTDLGRISDAGKHLLALINSVLDLSKVEAGKTEISWEDASVARILDEAAGAMAPLARKNNNQLVVSCEPDLPAMHVDVIKFRQSLYNLIANACKFTENGTVSVDVAPVNADGADWIEWRVRDTGIGIPADQIGKLFRPFTQVDASTSRKYGGTGLGLAISQRFCTLMGGAIRVASEPGKGSTFTIRLPYPRTEPILNPAAAATPALERHAPPRGAAPSNTVLVIDDDPAVRDLMTRSLRKAGFQVVLASSGMEGLRQARETRPAAITLDVFMPGINGWAVLSTLRTDPDLAEIPVILVTVSDDRKRACLLGATDFLQKPIHPDTLVAALKHRLGMPQETVLVVDDDPSSRDVAARTLRKHFGSVLEAADGRLALDCLRRHQVGLILLDLMMPGMDGFDFLQALRQVESWRRIPVVVLTAKEITPEDRNRLHGVRHILSKSDCPAMALAGEIADLLNGCLPANAGASLTEEH